MPQLNVTTTWIPALGRAWEGFEEKRPALAPLIKTLAVAFQLGLLLISFYLLELVSRGFLFLAVLTFFGFLINAVLPRSYRLHFFTLLSLVGVAVVLQPLNAAWIVGLGLLLISLCLLPLQIWIRVALLLGVGGILAYLRPGQSLVPQAVWPVLGSMFMFRLIIYFYDLRTLKTPPSASWTVSYFFMLPNVCFPLFPVVDFKKWMSSYYNEEDHSIYQRGILWMFRGAYQLVLYRLVYMYATINPTDVSGTLDFLRFALSSYLLYLRVSGYFHLIVGMLLLFGFNLPETHHRYYLASSFNDFWRRINIYWKDFMMKIFYYPAFFRLRKLGSTNALILSTFVVFFATWFLHAYQWFWLRGTLLLETHDALFWALLGVLVVFNSLYEQKFGRERSLGRRSRTLTGALALAFRTAATFTVICLLWSLWTADSLEQWLAMLSTTGVGQVVILLSGPVLYALSLAFRKLAQRTRGKELQAPKVPEPAFWDKALSTGPAVAILCLVFTPYVYQHFGHHGIELVETLRRPNLNTRDLELLERGYYESLLTANAQNAELWDLYNKRPLDWRPIQESEGWRPTNDMLMGGLQPNVSFQFKGARLSINRWGLRDQDYSKEKPPGTFRIAILGSSHVMGSGVPDGRTFEAQVEERLNAERPGAYERYQIINFATAARSPVQQLYLTETQVFAFEPDALLLVAHGQDEKIITRYLSRLLEGEVEIPYPFLRQVFEEAGVDAYTPDAVVQLKLDPYVDEILDWSYRQLTEECRRRGVTPVWVYLPMIYEEYDPADVERRLAHARESGFQTIDLATVYDSHPQSELAIAEWDNHPNELAHGLIARELYQSLTAKVDLELNEPPDTAVSSTPASSDDLSTQSGGV